ncbi:protein kinase domain-containing protein [Janthinobacterium sp. 64]|uniref:protein kinase domain-containing protein n=1 Tax=Janthinobacterium sp. 64 TaxID=2035208 RepID=UPI000C2C95A6|nr:winged helix-turn-helix domain-containing protein [Janthinobacterium sp. 64]PKB23476.1 non-specific serine/threonine protein kinase [Janthinobacterium sp. 64]
MGNVYRYRFGPVEFDEASGELSVNGLRAEIHPQGRALLSALLARRHEIVSRSELEAIVWKGGSASKEALATAVNRLRNALGESHASLIETVPRQGYRITGDGDRVVVGKTFESQIALAPGQAVPGRDHFRLERILGQSTSGEVWLACDAASGERRVFKFATDAQYLASLKRETTISRFLRDELGPRPDIAMVLDWNFEQPPFFMESEFGGDNLLEWSRQDGRLAQLDGAARLSLFLQIADAVAAAHGVSVLHKDLKPQNILIAPVAAGWQARLTDFGSARLLEPGRLEQLAITQLGMTGTHGVGSDVSQGTPMYIAPELFAGGATTQRSDVFALGVMLYQLLVGDMQRPLMPGWQRDIADSLLADDIAQATDGDPVRRLASVALLAERLRSLDARRAQAQAEHAAQEAAQLERARVRRFQAQRPWMLVSLAVLAVGLAASLVFYQQARRDQQALLRQVAVGQAMNRFLGEDLIAQANPSISGRAGVTMLEAARKAAPAIDARFKDSAPEVQVALHEAMQKTFSGLTEHQAAIAEGRLALRAGQAMPADSEQLAQIRVNLASDLIEMSQTSEAQAELDIVERWLASRQGRYPVIEAGYWLARATIATTAFDEKLGVEQTRRALQILGAMPQPPHAIEEYAMLMYADASRMAKDYGEAEKYFLKLIALQETRYGAQGARTCFTRLGLASTYSYLNRVEEAIAMLRDSAHCLKAALGMENTRTAIAYDILGAAYYKAQRYQESVDAYMTASPVYGRLKGQQSFHSVGARSSAALAYVGMGRYGEAEQLFIDTLRDVRAGNAEDSAAVQWNRYQLANCRLQQRRTDGVAALLQGLQEDTLGHAQVLLDWDGRLAYQRGRLALYTGQRAQALALLETAATIIAAKNPEGPISEAAIRALMASAK